PHMSTTRLLASALNLSPDEQSTFIAAARRQAQRFPAVTTPSGDPPPYAIPLPLTPLIGRAQEVAHIMALLTQPQIRWVTLAGLAGVGKTRLALAAARALAPTFAAGVAWIPLAPLRDP